MPNQWEHGRTLFNDTIEAAQEERDVEVYLALFLCFLTIFLGLLAATWLRKSRLGNVLSDAGLLLLIGTLVGFLVHLADNARVVGAIERMTWFDGDILFILLLPPIIFESGYTTSRSRFFKNFGSICLYAFLGTAIAASVTGLLVYAAGQAKLIFELNAVEAMTFGSLVSATDPVTVLAVFQQLGVDPDLYALVFGESVLNDAVAIVLFKTMLVFENRPVSFTLVMEGLVSFSLVFVGSFIVGVAMGCLNALVIKNVSPRGSESAGFEMAAVVLFPYMSYCLAEGLSLSGIVSILFCGFATAQYARENLSEEASKFTTSLFRTLAHIAEAFLFIYLGMAVFDSSEGRDQFMFSLYSLFAVFAARAVAVIPLTIILNYTCRRSTKRISTAQTFALWISGLRGAIAYALAAKAATELDDDGGTAGTVMESATMFITYFTILIVGGLMPWLSKKLKLAPPPQELSIDDDSGIEMRNIDQFEGDTSQRRPSEQSLLRRLDDRYIKPFLLSRDARGSRVIATEPRTAEDDRINPNSFEPLSASSQVEEHSVNKESRSRDTTEITLQ